MIPSAIGTIFLPMTASRFARGVALVLLLIVLDLPAFAASLADYKQRVDAAKAGVESTLEDLESLDDIQRNKLVSRIQSDIPATETIDWPGGSVETQNGWLRLKLKEFTDTRDLKNQSDVLVEISERLSAISDATGELDKAVNGDRTKDQDKQKLAEILSREEYQKPGVKEESLFQRWWREFMEWLARVFPRPAIEPGSPSGFASFQFGLQILIFVIVIAFVGFIVYKFAPFLGARFGKLSKNKKTDRVILGERIGADESASDLFADAERLARDGNLRGAIRKGYIAVLCDLSDRKLIRLARHKTNRDYLRDMRKNDALFENMRGLTFSFETNWYGLRSAEQADWEDFRERYNKTIADVRRN